MVLLLYCLPLLLTVDREVVYVVVAILSTITIQRLTEDWLMLLLLYCIPLLFKV